MSKRFILKTELQRLEELKNHPRPVSAQQVEFSRMMRSVEAANKWLKNQEATEEKLQEAKEMYYRIADEYRENGYPEKSSRLYWWALKVYNGMLINMDQTPFWC